jgi:hypothetical protein
LIYFANKITKNVKPSFDFIGLQTNFQLVTQYLKMYLKYSAFGHHHTLFKVMIEITLSRIFPDPLLSVPKAAPTSWPAR